MELDGALNTPPHGVADARRAFLQGAQHVPVRDMVTASWRRSRSAGVPADAYQSAYHEDVDFKSRLLRCAEPVIERLAEDMSDIPVAIALSDAQARIVHRIDCATSVGRPLDRVDFNAGFCFAEGGLGTNGIGTVIEAGTSVAVVGAEHFTEALVPFACTGAPVIDPLTGRVEGVLDVSSLAKDWTGLMHTLVRRAAADIGRALLLDRSLAKQAMFEAFARVDARPRQAVIAVGDSLMVNARAQMMFTPDEQSVLHRSGPGLLGRRDRGRRHGRSGCRPRRPGPGDPGLRRQRHGGHVAAAQRSARGDGTAGDRPADPPSHVAVLGAAARAGPGRRCGGGGGPGNRCHVGDLVTRRATGLCRAELRPAVAGAGGGGQRPVDGDR